MRKRLAAFLAGAMMLVGAASASATTSLPAEWGLIQPTSINVAQDYDMTKDLGYYIWTDDASRTSWHIRWVDGVNGGLEGFTKFSGIIALENNTGVFKTYSFETGQDSNDVFPKSDEFTSWIQNAEDGLDFVIKPLAQPSYVGFQLNYEGMPMDADNIYVGTERVSALGEDEDFVVPAPVPEPGTMMLLGAGFLGLAIYGKRKRNA